MKNQTPPPYRCPTQPNHWPDSQADGAEASLDPLKLTFLTAPTPNPLPYALNPGGQLPIFCHPRQCQVAILIPQPRAPSPHQPHFQCSPCCVPSHRISLPASPLRLCMLSVWMSGRIEALEVLGRASAVHGCSAVVSLPCTRSLVLHQG